MFLTGHIGAIKYHCDKICPSRFNSKRPMGHICPIVPLANPASHKKNYFVRIYLFLTLLNHFIKFLFTKTKVVRKGLCQLIISHLLLDLFHQNWTITKRTGFFCF